MLVEGDVRVRLSLVVEWLFELSNIWLILSTIFYLGTKIFIFGNFCAFTVDCC